MNYMTKSPDALKEEMKREAAALSTMEIVDNLTHQISFIKQTLLLIDHADEELVLHPAAVLFDSEMKLDNISILVETLADRANKAN